LSLPRIALMGSLAPCLAALCEAGHPVLLVTAPLDRRAQIARRFGRGRLPIEAAARRYGVPVVHCGAGAEAALREFRPDLICIAAFPRLVPAGIRALAPGGAINLHTSLLPRHRGPDPVFWTYYHGDRESGWTAHRATDRFDEGAILLQEPFSLPRGLPVGELGRELRERAGPFLLRAIAAAGSAQERAQVEEQATRAPRVDLNAFRVPFESWDVEQVWHFLAGFADRFRQPLVDDLGRRVTYRRVPGFERGAAGPAGTVVRDGAAWRLSCLGGTVLLAP